MISEPSVLAEPLGGRARARTSFFYPLALYSIAHFLIDLYSSALGAFQPVLVERLGLSLTQAGLLGGVLIFSSSVMQPAFGYLSDRFHTRQFTVLAPAVAGVFITAMCLASSYGSLLALVTLGGAGIASFHPQASARATLGIPTNKARWFAVFISAGTLGMAIGPALFSEYITSAGFERIYWLAIPGVLMTAWLFFQLPDGVESTGRAKFEWRPLAAQWKPLLVLYLLVFIRSILQITFAQLLPLYLTRERAFAFDSANWTLSMYLTAGALGGFFGGHLADRFGGRAVIVVSMIGCVPFLCLFFFTTGWVSLLGFALGGFMLLFTIPVNVVMAQDLVPTQAGTVSALMMGFSWGMAGLIFIPLAGWASDQLSMHTVLSSLVVFPVAGFLLALRLRK